MRWLYVEPGNKAEVVAQAAIRLQIDRWWKEFAKQHKRLANVFTGEEKWDVPAWMDRHLHPIHPEIMWEFGPAVECEGHRLVLTPEGARHLRPLVNEIVERAPQIDGWEFYPRRLNEPDFEMLQATLDARAPCDVTGGTVMLTGNENRKIDCVFHFPNESERSTDEQTEAAFIALETLVGEAFLDQWIGGIEVREKLPAKPKVKPIPLDRLHDTAIALAESIRDQLRPQTIRDSMTAEESEWASIELEPEESDDYPARSDILLLGTMLTDVMTAHLSGLLFYSSSHSRCGETFAYLKIDAEEIEWEQRVDYRQNVADKVDEALRAAGVGCIFGGGTGIRYLYVDVAVTDIPKTVRVLREAFAESDLPQRSWLLFFDDDLCGEWIGIDPSVEEPPAPPTEEDEDE